jgi:hypothetical protein
MVPDKSSTASQRYGAIELLHPITLTMMVRPLQERCDFEIIDQTA